MEKISDIYGLFQQKTILVYLIGLQLIEYLLLQKYLSF